MTRKVIVAASSVLGLTAALLAVSPAWADETEGSASTYSTPAGSSVTFTVTNHTDPADWDWCDLQTGPGFSMTLLFAANIGGADFVLPTGSIDPGNPGAGSFTWSAAPSETESVTVTIPVDAVPGTYEVILGCVTPGPDYLHPLDVARPIDFEITAPAPAPTPAPTPDAELPNTGADTTVALVASGLAGIALVAGVGTLALRRRVTAKK
jgi:LPXTG-motif cell wall-anchored protein